MINHDKLILFTQQLVQQPGLSGEEAHVAQRVADEMRSLGFDQVQFDANGSVIGVIEGAQPGKTLLLDAHTDTVGISPGVAWRHDPYAARIEDEAIFGRGSADMKGALAAMIYAAAAVDRSQLRGRVVVSASVLEEVLEGVALRDVINQVHPDFVVIGEPTNLHLNRGGRGRAELHLKTIGKPAHSSSPQWGRNAVLDMMHVIAAIEDRAVPEDKLLGPAIMALTDIVSDPYPGNSVIPSVCKATFDRRLLAGENANAVINEIKHLPGLADIQLEVAIPNAQYAAYTGTTLRSEKFFPAWLFPETDAFVQRCLVGLHSIALQPKLGAYRFCTNATYSAGVAGIPTIGFGPASEGDAHVVDERLKLADLLAVANGYAAIMAAVLV